MNPFLLLFGWVWDFRNWLLESANWLRSHIPSWLFPIADWLETPIGWIDTLAVWLSGPIDGLSQAARWYDTVSEAVVSFISKSWLLDFLSNPLAVLNQVGSWFSNWWGNVTSVVSTWWSGVSTTVLGWVEAGKSYALGLVNNLQGLFNSLQSAWNNFTGTVLPTLASRFDIDQMIKSAFAPWSDLFNFWGKVGS